MKIICLLLIFFSSAICQNNHDSYFTSDFDLSSFYSRKLGLGS
jgi:hypothetical protein